MSQLFDVMYPDYGYGPRPDGTMKGPGFASMTMPNGGVMTEFSAGPEDGLYPLVYDGITLPEAMTLRREAMYGNADPYSMWRINENAHAAAATRQAQGLPVFYSPMYDAPRWRMHVGDDGLSYRLR